MLLKKIMEVPLGRGPSDNASTETVYNVRLHTGWFNCNYSCPYCIAEQGNPQRFKNPEEFKWKNSDRFQTIIDNLKKIPLQLNIRPQIPGELFTNKSLTNMLKSLSRSDNVRSMNIVTNLSLSREQYASILEDVDPGKWAFISSYHPTEVPDRNKWLDTVLYLNETFEICVVLIAWPPLLGQLEENMKFFQASGLQVFVQGYIGPWEGRRYPEAYADEERALLKRLAYSRHDYEFLVAGKPPGLCNAGYKSFYVAISGRVTPCGMGKYVESMGDLSVSPEITLKDGPRPCPFKTCQCDTENRNTVIFQNYYKMNGIHQHRYSYRFKEEAKQNSSLDEWVVAY